MGIHNNALIGGSGQGGYFINNSLRFRSGASPYLSRTASVAGNRQKFTLSMWVKIGKTGTYINGYRGGLFGSGNCATGGGSGLGVHIQGNNEGSGIQAFVGGATTMLLVTNYKFRDPAAWYHLVFSIDTTQATAANRFRMYVNNQEITSFSSNTQISQNYSFDWNNSSSAIYLGAYNDGTPISTFFDGYMAEVYHVDGQQLTPSSFGQNDSLTGQWVPKAYLSTYGTNGFYLKFADTSGVTAATIGKDSSGNGNNLTPSGISNTAGVTYDFMIDSPTVGPLASNYAVMSPLIRQGNNGTDFTADGNLKYTVGANGGYTSSTFATIPMTSGKWYAEVYINAAVTAQWVGVSSDVPKAGLGTYGSGGTRNPGYAYKVNTGNKCNNDNTGTAYAASSTTGDIIGIAMDADAGSITFYKNGTSLGVAYTGMTNTGNGWLFGSDSDPNGSFHWNFGQRPFSYTQPSGYLALNTFNLSVPAIKKGSDYMDIALQTGTGAAADFPMPNGMAPDFGWLKTRSTGSTNHLLTNRLVSNGNTASSNSDAAEFSNPALYFSGNNMGMQPYNSDAGVNGRTYVLWGWKAGGGTAVTNTSGTISSQVSANPTAGFSIVTYTGTGANATVGHGLGVAPSMMLFKNRTSIYNWAVYHASLANASTTLELNNTGAATGGNATTFNSTAPTSSVFSLGTNDRVNRGSNLHVAYCFAPVAGYSAFGSYTANGSTDGPFLYLGFRPRFIMLKRYNNSGAPWTMIDTSRSPYNAAALELDAHDTVAEYAAGNGMDILSNGIKLRASDYFNSGSGDTFLYMAFAENPFKYANAR
jgi:hypothetical protein